MAFGMHVAPPIADMLQFPNPGTPFWVELSCPAFKRVAVVRYVARYGFWHANLAGMKTVWLGLAVLHALHPVFHSPHADMLLEYHIYSFCLTQLGC